MTSGDYDSPPGLNENQARRLSVTCKYIDRVIGDIEEILNSAASKAAFPQYIQDITPLQRRTIEDYLARFRAQLARVLEGQGLPRPDAWLPTSRAVYTSLTVIDIAAEELRPRYMRGYGDMPSELATELEGISGELRGLVARLNQYLLQGAGQDLRQRLQRLEQTSAELELLAKLERIVTERGLVEFRSTIAGIAERLEDQSLEIAVFGRVSAGKSSLLNAVLGEEILPVGVTPITAVPTRIRYGDTPRLTVWYAERPAQTLEIARLIEVASEKGNPHNEKRVTRIVVNLPSARLRDGVTFVDTPGLGSLATTGAAETLAYLPKCDLGVVLIDAGSTLTDDDLQTIQTLEEAAIPVQILLSKADLLSPKEVEDSVRYVTENVEKECRIELSVYPVSALPNHRSFLDRWFESEILPLYERSRELKSLSVKRKVGALRDAIVAALSMRRRRNRGLPSTDPESIRDVELRLRRATGSITESQVHLEREIEAFSRDTGWLLERAADRLAQAWAREGEGSAKHELEVFETIVRSVHQQVKVFRQYMETLAHDLQSELSSAAKKLSLPLGLSEEEFTSAIRAMPVFDITSRDLHLSPPAWSRLFGKAGRRTAARRALRSQLEGSLGNVLSIYGGVFKDWSSGVLKEIETRFANYAESYRAQAERAQAGTTLGTDEERALLSDLHSLGATPSDSEIRMPAVASD